MSKVITKQELLAEFKKMNDLMELRWQEGVKKDDECLREGASMVQTCLEIMKKELFKE